MTTAARRPVAVPVVLHDRLVTEAARRDVSVARLVQWAIERQLPEWEQQDLDALLRTRS